MTSAVFGYMPGLVCVTVYSHETDPPTASSVPIRAEQAEKSVAPDWESVRLVIHTASGEVFVTVSVKTKSPPGSGRIFGVASFSSVTVGSTSLKVTVAGSESSSVLPSSSDATAVTTFVCAVSVSEARNFVMEHEYWPPLAASVCGTMQSP